MIRFFLTSAVLCACMLLCRLAAAQPEGGATGAAASAEVIPEPVPEQAFTGAPSQGSLPTSAAEMEAPANALKAQPLEAQSAPGLFSTPSPEIVPTTSFSELLDAEKTPPPFYKRWLDALFDLIAPDDPYRRDKLTLLFGTSIGYDNNVLYSPTSPMASATYGFHAATDYHFGSRRLTLDAKLVGGVTYYQHRPGGASDNNYGLTLALDYKLTPRLEMTANTYTAYLSQPSPQLVGGSFAYTGSYLYTDTELNVSYQIRPRLGVTLGYSVSGFKYDDEVINDGSGFFQQNYSISGNWLLTPRTTVTLQYRYNPVSYYESGVGSTGQFLLVGVQQTLSPRLIYSLTGGAEFRSLENPAPGSPTSYLGPFAEGSLSYHFAPRSSLVGSMRLGTEPSGTTGVTIKQTFRASLGVTHSLGSRVSLEANISYEKDNYDQPGVIPDFTQDIYTASLVLRYQFALFTSVVIRDDYLFLGASTPDSSYNHNAVSLGLEVTF